MKKLIGFLGVALLLGIGFYFISYSISPSSPDTANYYSGYLNSIDSELNFTLDCCDQVLQLGMITVVDKSQENMAKIESLMKKYELRCTASNMGERQVDVDAVYCSTEDGLLAGQLIDAGLVEERCEQTANQFGTCGSADELTSENLSVLQKQLDQRNKTKGFPIYPNEHTPTVVGTYKGISVEEQYWCSDVCPDNGILFLNLVSSTEETCEDLGGNKLYKWGWGSQYVGCSPTENKYSD